ncbi:MAG: branched-chain amino acid ABC transporter permease, partial [Chloroflexota bacterium]
MRQAALAVLLLALLGVPFATSGYFLRLLTLLFTFAVMAEGWNLIGGYTGYTDFGSVVFFGLGGYTTGLLMTQLKLPFVVGWLAGAVLCTVFAILMGLLLLRLRGHYFGIATLGTSFAVREIIANWPSVTGGGTGISLPIYDFPNSV